MSTFGTPSAPAPPAPPKQLTSPSLMPSVELQSLAVHGRSTQSATSSHTLPTMSEIPQLDVQLAREPAATGPTESVAHVVDPSSAVPGSGVPAAAPCHSREVSSRFPESRHAWLARNHEMQALGFT